MYRRLTAEGTPTWAEGFVAGAPDGAVYFDAMSGSDYGTAIWKVSAPGAMPVRVGPNPHGNANAWQATVAPACASAMAIAAPSPLADPVTRAILLSRRKLSRMFADVFCMVKANVRCGLELEQLRLITSRRAHNARYITRAST